MTDKRRVRLSALPGPAAGGVSGRTAAAELWAELPDRFARTAFPLGEQPFASLLYQPATATPSRAVIDCSGLPEAMGQEIAWWVYSLSRTGEQVTPSALRFWTHALGHMNDTRVRHGQVPVGSFLDLSVAEWLAAGRACYVATTGRLPTRSYTSGYEPALRRLHGALTARCDPAEWWRAEVWDPTHDRRIPQRPHEPLGSRRLSFSGVEPGWLTEAVRWFLAYGLQTGAHCWSSLPNYRTHLCTYFAEFLREAGIDSPALCAHPDQELRTVMARYLDYLRSRQAESAGRSGLLAAQTIGTAQSILARFYAFMLDHKSDAVSVLGEPRWSALSQAHGRLWRPGELAHRRKTGSAGPSTRYLEPEVLTRIAEHIDILADPLGETRTVDVDGRLVEVTGFGDPQAMRAYLLAMLTARRINEILLMDFEPLEPLVGLDAIGGADPDAFVARLRYQQTKIDGAPSTILVEAAVVNIIREQQAWIQEHVLPEMLAGDTGEAVPRYLFVAAKRNRHGLRPYSAHTLHARLGSLARTLQLRDSSGALVDFQRTHRLRHSKATTLINAGVPLHVVQRYLGHRSPEMTMHYAATLEQTHEREFLKLAKIGRDGRALDLDPRDVYEITQLDRRTDRVLPNGVCLLPPAKHCDKGNACARCEFFATDRSHLADHREQLAATLVLIDARKAQHLERTGSEMTDDNVWLEARVAETRSLELIIAALELEDSAQVERAVRGAGTRTRTVSGHPEPISIDTRRWRRDDRKS